jgi:hypothetical protein
MKFWITKYALTQGIFQVEAADPAKDKWPDILSVKQENTYPQHFHGEGRDWHRTEAEAIARANEMVADKISSLKKQLKKLEKTVF